MPKPYVVVNRQLGGIGDFLMLSPVFRGIKEVCPDHEVHLITSSTYLNGALLDMARRNPYIDVIHDIDPRECTTPQTAAVHGFEGAQDLQLSYPLIKGAREFTDLNTACIAHEHTVDSPKHRTLIWCEETGVFPSDYSPIYSTTKKERQAAKDVFKRLGWEGKKVVGVTVSSMHPARMLHALRLKELLEALQAKGYTPVTIDAQFTTSWAQSIAGISLTETFALVEQMSGFISTDTGLLHVAGTMKVPLVGIFGAVPSKARIAYYANAVGLDTSLACAPCWYNHSCCEDADVNNHFACMQRVSVPQVLDALDKVMK